MRWERVLLAAAEGIAGACMMVAEVIREETGDSPPERTEEPSPEDLSAPSVPVIIPPQALKMIAHPGDVAWHGGNYDCPHETTHRAYSFVVCSACGAQRPQTDDDGPGPAPIVKMKR